MACDAKPDWQRKSGSEWWRGQAALRLKCTCAQYVIFVLPRFAHMPEDADTLASRARTSHCAGMVKSNPVRNHSTFSRGLSAIIAHNKQTK